MSKIVFYTASTWKHKCHFFILFHSVAGPTTHTARMVAKMGQGMRIHISDTTKFCLDKFGGFRCDYRGIMDLGVSVHSCMKSTLAQGRNSIDLLNSSCHRIFNLFTTKGRYGSNRNVLDGWQRQQFGCRGSHSWIGRHWCSKSHVNHYQ